MFFSNYKKIIIFLIITLMIVFSVSNEELNQIKWFVLSGELKEEWALSVEKGIYNECLITPIGKSDVQKNSKKVLVLFCKESSAYTIAMNTILQVFSDKKISTVFKIINYQNNVSIGKKALDFALSNNYDLIFSMGSESTEFINNNFKGKSIPVVTVCSKDPVLLGLVNDYDKGSSTNIAYTSLNVPVSVQISYLKMLNSNLKNIILLYDIKNKSAIITQVIPMIEEANKYNLKIFKVAVEDEKKSKEELNKKIPLVISQIIKIDPEKENTIILITGSTSVFNEIETINKQASRIPVISMVPDIVKEGDNSAALSIGIGFESNAHLAAIYGVNILKKIAKPGELKVGVVSPPDIAINFKKIKDLKIKIPFFFFESATFIYDYMGFIVRDKGKNL